MKPTYVVTDNNILVVINGKQLSANESHPFFTKIKSAILDHNWEKATKYFDISEQVKEYSSGRLELRDGEIYTTERNVYLKTALTKWVIDAIKDNTSSTFLINFINKVEQNERSHVREQIHNFITVGGLPICTDGSFIAYKSIREDYMDIHSGTCLNAVGTTLEMPEGDCGEGDVCCSPGYHFGTESFVTKQFCGDRIVVVKINPADVLATPNNQGKGRCHRYTVVGEIGKDMEFFKTTTVQI